MTDEVARWQRAALLKDRTRREIRSRIAAGDTIPATAKDFDVPEEFVTVLASWQMFADEPKR